MQYSDCYPSSKTIWQLIFLTHPFSFSVNYFSSHLSKLPVSTMGVRCGQKRTKVGTDHASHLMLPPKVGVQRENSLVSSPASSSPEEGTPIPESNQ